MEEELIRRFRNRKSVIWVSREIFVNTKKGIWRRR